MIRAFFGPLWWLGFALLLLLAFLFGYTAGAAIGWL